MVCRETARCSEHGWIAPEDVTPDGTHRDCGAKVQPGKSSAMSKSKMNGVEPDALVVTCGTDALDGDPLSGLALSNLALWNAVEALLELTGRKVVLGGGGYNPWTLIRCWSGLWARLSKRTVPDVLPLSAQVYLQQLECDLVDDEDVRAEWITSLADRGNHGPLREVVKERVGMVLR